MRIYSWNVNGLRAATRKGFTYWLGRCKGDVVGVQEVRATEDQLERRVSRPRRWHTHFVSAERKGYSGVGLFSRLAPDHVEVGLGRPEFDAEGRVQIAHFGRLVVANVYFPNGNGSTLPNGKRSNDRIPFKLAFYRAVYARLDKLRSEGRPVLVMGDFNTAHRDVDLARPRQNRGTSGFTAVEREELDRWLRNGWVDTFRARYPDEEGHYSWWSQRGTCRKRNIGWRIDYVLASEAAMAHLTDAFILPRAMGSDHCPVGVDLDDAVAGG